MKQVEIQQQELYPPTSRNREGSVDHELRAEIQRSNDWTGDYGQQQVTNGNNGQLGLMDYGQQQQLQLYVPASTEQPQQQFHRTNRPRQMDHVLKGLNEGTRGALGTWIFGKRAQPLRKSNQGFDAAHVQTTGLGTAGYDAEAGGGYLGPQGPQDPQEPLLPLPSPVQYSLHVPTHMDKIKLSYDDSMQPRLPDPSIDQALLLEFDRGGPLNGQMVAPTPQRQAVMNAQHTPQEELGLFKDKGTELGIGSLLKLEQRLAKAVAIDQRALAERVHANVEGFLGVAMDAALSAQKQQLQQQLMIGSLPPLAEEPDSIAAALPGAVLPQNLHYREHGQLLPPLPYQQQQQQPQYDIHGNIVLPPPPLQSSTDGRLQDSSSQAGPNWGLTHPRVQQQQLQYDASNQLVLQGLVPPSNQQGDGAQSTQGVWMQGGLMQSAALQESGLQGGPMISMRSLGTRSPWFDEDGLLACLPNPLLPQKERPMRRYDQDRETTQMYVRLPVLEDSAANEDARTYRLDIELGQLEFMLHPDMAIEDMMASRLLAAFREFKRREAVGLAAYYANKLAALEDALLASREHLFTLSELDASVAASALGNDKGQAGQEVARIEAEVKEALAHTAGLEKEVAETRQLKEEEEKCMMNAVHSMLVMYDQILVQRVIQGYWLTGLELTVEQRPPEEEQWSLGTGVPRDRLDAELLVAEEEAIAGLPPPPLSFPLPPSMSELPDNGFKPRRLETMCASHSKLVSDLSSRLEGLRTRSSADPSDPVILQLEDQLRALGPTPRRLAPVTPEQRAEALTHAAHRVSLGDVGVPRHPCLVPMLSISPHHALVANSSQAGAQEAQQGLQSPSQIEARLGPMHAPRPQSKSNTRYVAKLYVNGHYVDRTRGLALGDGFTATFNEVFSVQLLKWPESITVHICEQGTFVDTPLSVIHVAVPGLMGTPHIDPCPKHYQFASQVPHPLKVRTHWSGSREKTDLMYPTGALHVRCGWVSGSAPAGAHMADQAAHRADQVVTYNNPLAEDGQVPDVEAATNLMPPLPHVTIDRMLRQAADRIRGKADRQQVLRWLCQHTFDPNDPPNAPLMELMKTHEATSGGMGDEFNLDVSPDVALEGDRQQAKRAAFLARRWASSPFRDPEKSVLKGMRRIRIPAVLSTADTEEMEHVYAEALSLVELAPGGSGPAVARAMNARKDRAMMMQVGPDLTQGIEEREARIKAFGLCIKTAATRIAGGKKAARKYKTEDVVNDSPLPEFKVDINSFLSLFKPRRPLKREHKVVKSLVTSVPAETQLMVTIQRVADLPVRAPTARGGWQPGNDLGMPDQYAATSVPTLSPAHCFVEVLFRGISQRTITTSSQYPTFNEQILLPVFNTGQEPSTSALLDSREVITINVFDEVILDRVGRPRVPRFNNEVETSQPMKYLEREQRFLGCAHVPLNAVYQMQVLEGTLRLEVPPVLLGYTYLSERPPCVTLYMSLRPRLAPPPIAPEALLSGEAEEVTRHARTWLSDVVELPQCRTRVVRSLAMEPDGTSLLVTRFVAPTPLPPHLHNLASNIILPPFATVSPTEAVMLKLARFVALVPYLEDSALQKRQADVWATSAQVMAMTAGDGEEHAHLLVGFFLEIGQQAFVVVGSSCNGATSYFVLTTGAPACDPHNPQAQPKLSWPDDVQLRVWNPLTGSVVSVKDTTAELREVGMVYDHSNMWANVQIEAQPWNMNWNLLSPLNWKPFFGTQLTPRELGTVQTTPIYEEREDLLYEQMENRAEEVVREVLTKARSLAAFVTKPDNKVSRVLKQLLMEVPAAMEGVSAASLAASLALAQAQAQGLLPGGIEAGSRLGERHQAIAALQARHNAIVAHESRAEWVNGHILAIPFSDRYAEALTEAVLNTGIHRIADERVKYSLAVCVERAGVAFCCCLWVYVAVTR